MPEPSAPSARRIPRVTVLLLPFFSVALVAGIAEIGFRALGYTAIYEVYSKPSLFWVHDDRLGWAHEPGAEGIYRGPRPFPIEFEAPIRINALGLRGPLPGPRDPGELRILVLGDSVVAGFEVAWKDTFTAILETDLQRQLDRPVRVINAGVRGYGTDQSLLYYQYRGRDLDPDLVIFVHSPNDLMDNWTLHRARRPFGKAAFTQDPDGELRLVGAPVPSYPLCSAWMVRDGRPTRVDTTMTRGACWVQTRLADHSALFTFVAQAVARMPAIVHFLKNLTYPDAQKKASDPRPHLAGFLGWGSAAQAAGSPTSAQGLTVALLARLAGDVEQDGAELVVVAKPRAMVAIEGLKDHGVPVHATVANVDLDSTMMRWHNDGHMNERGHRVMALILGDVVRAHLPGGAGKRWAPRRR